VVDDWLRNVAIEFCERTKAHVVDLDPVDAVANQMAYGLEVPTGKELIEIISVWFSGDKITPKSPAFLENKYGDWAAEIDTPQFYLQQDTENLLLVPAPSTAEVGAIKIKAAIKPTSTATGIDDWLFSQWHLALAAGAKSKMMAMGGGVSWESPSRVPIYLSAFEDAIARASTRAADGFVRARPRFSGSFC
jgi:hypothetical protein